MAYVFLAAAIVSEIIGALATRFSDGFTKLVPSAVATVGVLGAYILLAQSLKLGMGIGAAYAIWAAVGVAVVGLVGAVFLGDKLTLTQLAGLVLIIGGVVAVELGGAGEQTH